MSKVFLTLVMTVTFGVGLVSSAQARERYCREYTDHVNIGRGLEQSYGTACMQPDGSWEIVSQSHQPVVTYAPPIQTVRHIVREERNYVSPFNINIDLGSHGFRGWGNRHWKHRGYSNHHGGHRKHGRNHGRRWSNNHGDGGHHGGHRGRRGHRGHGYGNYNPFGGHQNHGFNSHR